MTLDPNRSAELQLFLSLQKQTSTFEYESFLQEFSIFWPLFEKVP
jgi:hypothetical protein